MFLGLRGPAATVASGPRDATLSWGSGEVPWGPACCCRSWVQLQVWEPVRGHGLWPRSLILGFSC